MENLNNFLRIKQPMSDTPTRFSNIILLLKAARKHTGRNIESGIYEMNEINEVDINNGIYHSLQYVGLINYLILLEQIGSILIPKDQSISTNNGIFCSLKYYSKLNDDLKISALVALRHSLTHKFGLATQIQSKDNKKLQHRFALSIERNPEIVKLPLIPWNGIFKDKSDESHTIIFVKDFEDLVEDVFQTIKDKLNNNELELKIEIDELYSRYTMVY